MDSVQTTVPQSVERTLAPYGRTQFLWTGALLGSIGVAILGARNENRLVQPRRILLVILICVMFLLLATITNSIALSILHIQALSTGSSALIRALEAFPLTPYLIGFVLGVLNALVIMRLQRGNYQEWIQAHGGKKPTFAGMGGWRAVLVLILASIGLSILLAFPLLYVANLFRSTTINLAPGAVFTDPAFSITYPNGWVPLELTTVDSEECQQVECLFAIIAVNDQAVIIVVRDGSVQARSTPLDRLRPYLLPGVPEGRRSVGEPVEFALDGQPARQVAILTGTAQGFTTTYVIQTRQSNGAVLTIVANLTGHNKPIYYYGVDEIINSIDFTENAVATSTS
jgi:hypothetical protein